MCVCVCVCVCVCMCVCVCVCACGNRLLLQVERRYIVRTYISILCTVN